MKIVAIIVTLIGLAITGICSLGTAFSLYTAVNSMTNSAARGVGTPASWLGYAQILSYINLFGVVILVLGVILMIAAMYMGRKNQQAAV